MKGQTMETNQMVNEGIENKDIDTIRFRAWLIALGQEPAADDEAVEIRGAWNDYNARGRGSTTARRVLRDGSWQWVSPPASRGRYLAGDRKDVKAGSVYEGEIIAQFTLGGNREPDRFWIVVNGAEKPLKEIDGKRIKTGYRLSIPESTETLEVSDPYWR